MTARRLLQHAQCEKALQIRELLPNEAGASRLRRVPQVFIEILDGSCILMPERANDAEKLIDFGYAAQWVQPARSERAGLRGVEPAQFPDRQRPHAKSMSVI